MADDLDAELASAARLLKRMPRRRRRIFRMHLMQTPYSEIAIRLGLPLETVRSELVRAFETCAAHPMKARKNSRSGKP